MSNSDSGEEEEHCESFLKGGTLTVSRSTVANCVDADITRNNNHGWVNTDTSKGTQKIVASIIECRIFTSNVKGINTRKTQHERATRKIKRSKQEKEDQLKELGSHAKELKIQMTLQPKVSIKVHAQKACKNL